MKLDKEELARKMAQDLAQSRAQIEVLMQEDLLDDHGYPTEAAQEIIRLWHWSDPRGWFVFINDLWEFRLSAWSEGTQPSERDKNEWVYLYKISTGGWSGNESLIRAMQSNDMLWHTSWVQSRRGGHYIFEIEAL